jgi:hypothetical membrane protein
MFTQFSNRTHDILVPGRNAPQKQQRAILAFTITIVGIAVYVVLNVIAQLLPPHYSPLRQAMSDLAVGPYGWLAFVPTDSVDANGYPGSVQALHMITTLHGAIHIVLSFIAFTSGLLATLFISLRFSRDEHLRSLRTPALILALLMWPAFLLTDTFAKLGLYGVGERLFVSLGLL